MDGEAARRSREDEPANEARRRGGPPVGTAWSPLSLRERGWGEGTRHPRRNGTPLAQSTASAQEPRMSSRVARKVCAAPSTGLQLAPPGAPLPPGEGWGEGTRHPRRNGTPLAQSTASAQEPPNIQPSLHVGLRGTINRPSSWHRLEPLSLRERGWGEGTRHHAATARHSRNQPRPRRNPRMSSRVCTSVCAAPSTGPPVGAAWSPSPSGRGVGVRAPATHAATARHSRNQPLPRRKPRNIQPSCTSVCTEPSTGPAAMTIVSRRSVAASACSPVPGRQSMAGVHSRTKPCFVAPVTRPASAARRCHRRRSC